MSQHAVQTVSPETIDAWRREAAALREHLREEPQSPSAWYWRVRLQIVTYLIEQHPSGPTDRPTIEAEAPAAYVPSPGPAPTSAPMPAKERKAPSPPRLRRRFRSDLRSIADANAEAAAGPAKRVRRLLRSLAAGRARRRAIRSVDAQCDALTAQRARTISDFIASIIPLLTADELHRLASPEISEGELTTFLDDQPHRAPGLPRPTIYCRRCRYPLNWLAHARCPECGRPFDPTDPRSYRSKTR